MLNYTLKGGVPLKNLFLTGKKGVGKSTLLKKALDSLDLSVGGYVTERIFDGVYRKYAVRSLCKPYENYIIIKVDSRDDSKVWYPSVFEDNLVPLLDKSLSKDIIVLDELGSSENKIVKFTSKVFEVLNSSKIVFGVLQDGSCEFTDAIKSRDDVVIIRVTEENRDCLLDEIVGILKSWI